MSSTRSDAKRRSASPRVRRSPDDAPRARRSRSLRARHGAQRLPVQGTAVRRQRRPVRGPAQQLSERSARPAHRHPDHAGAGLHGGRAARGVSRRRRSTSRATSWCAAAAAARRRRTCRRDLIIDALSRRRAAVRGRLPRAAAPARRRRRRRGTSRALGHATKPQILARMLLNLKRVYVQDVLVPAGARHHRAAAGGRSVGHERAARPRAARLSPERLLRRAAGSAGVPAARRRKTELDEDERDEQAQIWEHVKSLRRRVASLN